MDPRLLGFLVATIAGAACMVTSVRSSRRPAPDVEAFLSELLPSELPEPLAEPFLQRVILGPVARRLERLLPGDYLEKTGMLLAQAGLAGQRSAGQQLAIEIACAVAGAVVSALLLLRHPPSGLAVGLLLLPAIGFMLPSARLKRTIRERSDHIFKDLPDMIDMLAIAVEAGSGFEAALTLICDHFQSPMADELAFALNEMSLGMPRKEALQGLKQRADLPVVRTFALALIQADALGIPISRVLRSQATEIRAQRRAWAREKAAKMPIKILFPLVLFVFPPILAIVIGPAALSFTHL